MPAVRQNMLIGYARVSTPDQDLTLQIDALTKAGCEKIFTDKASGAKSDRPGLAEALRFARSGDALVIWKLDRLGRSIRGLIELAAGLSARKVDFRSLTDGFDTATPSGRLLFHILASVAEMERELIKERTIAGLAAVRAKGGSGGGRKVAMTLDKIDTAHKLLAAGDKPAKIAKLLQIGLSTFYRHCPGRSATIKLTRPRHSHVPRRYGNRESGGHLAGCSQSGTASRLRGKRDPRHRRDARLF